MQLIILAKELLYDLSLNAVTVGVGYSIFLIKTKIEFNMRLIYLDL